LHGHEYFVFVGIVIPTTVGIPGTERKQVSMMFARAILLKNSLGIVALFFALAAQIPLNTMKAATNEFEVGAIAFLDGKLERAIQSWSTAAANGDNLAQYNLGLMNRDGIGLPKNYAGALKWFASASKNGNPIASIQMAELFEYGNGVPKNYQMAVVLFHVGAAALPAGPCRELVNKRIDTLAVHLTGVDLVSAIREAKQSSGPSPKSPRPWWTDKNCLSKVMLPEPTEKTERQNPGNGSVLVAKDKSTSSIQSEKSSLSTSQNGGVSNRIEYFIQVASYLGRQSALQEQIRFISRYEDILSQMHAKIVEGQSLDLGTVYRVRFGPYKDKSTALETCNVIKKMNEACLVYEGRTQTNATRGAELTDG
jgi:Sel1 repeat/SPOR domain